MNLIHLNQWLFIPFCFFLGMMNAQVVNETINQKDIHGKKQGKWIYYGKDRPKSGYPKNAKIEEGYFKNNRKEGTWIYYYKDGITPKLIGNYVNNRPHGEYSKYYSDGQLEEAGQFVRNVMVDTFRRYYPNGVIQYETVYNQQGKENGTTRFCFPSGKTELIYSSNSGQPLGRAVRYYPNGDIKEILIFGIKGAVAKRELKAMIHPEPKEINTQKAIQKNYTAVKFNTKGVLFQPNGYNKVYNSNDEIWQDGDFKNGRLWHGKIYEYDRDGILLKVKVYQNGAYLSDGQL